MILSDRSLREAIEDGRLVIDPLADDAIQPSSIDLRLGEGFRVFANHRYPHIDVRQPMEGLTELVEASGEEPFILHPGEFVLAATLERVALPQDLVARLEGKSSLGRLGLLIHSSLPASEPVVFLHEGELTRRPISEIVEKQLEGCVVAFDPESFEVGFHPVTGWYEGPADRIYEIDLASGRSVRVTAGHNLFTLAPDGQLVKTRTVELEPGTQVAVPRRIPAPNLPSPRIRIAELAPSAEYGDLIVRGPTVEDTWQRYADDAMRGLRDAGLGHRSWYREEGQLPLSVLAQLPGLPAGLTAEDRIAAKGGKHELAAVVPIDDDVAWLLGLYVAEGSRRRTQVTWSNTDRAVLDRAESIVSGLGIEPYRTDGVVTACSKLLSSVLRWMEIGPGARDKRIPRGVLGWPDQLLGTFLEAFAVGDGSFEETRLSLWTSSELLVGDLLLTLTRLGKRAGSCYRERDGNPLHQIYAPYREHKLLTSTPPLHRLLVSLREGTGLTQREASRRMGYRHGTGLNNLEKGHNRSIRLATLRRVRDGYWGASLDTVSRRRLDRVIDGDLLWDRVVSVRDTGTTEAIYDLEVRPDGAHVENFLAGQGGVFVSNTAGFIDAGWDGHLTLELSNVANLPIILYPGMKIGQLALFRLDQPAEHAYGSEEVGSKYQGQRGPTESRYHLNFDEDH